MKRVLSFILTFGVVGGLALAQAPDDTFVHPNAGGRTRVSRPGPGLRLGLGYGAAKRLRNALHL